jgi:hypothetical protein
MTGADERLLDGIQKLIKREIPQQTLSLDAALAERARDGERERRTPREAREARPAREGWRDSPREGGREARPAREGAAPRREARPRTQLPGHSEDPFFYKPYEPGAAAAEPAAEASGAGTPGSVAATSGPRRRQARPVAALLGGVRKG